MLNTELQLAAGYLSIAKGLGKMGNTYVVFDPSQCFTKYNLLLLLLSVVSSTETTTDFRNQSSKTVQICVLQLVKVYF